MAKKIVIQTPPTQPALNTVGFDQSEFEKTIAEKGYDVIWEKALRCPCKTSSTNHSSKCKNCGSVGWIYINPVMTKMLLHSMNENTKFKAWSQENEGQVAISFLNQDQLCYMDKITLVKNTATFNECRFFKKSDTDLLYTYLSYHTKSIDYIGLFVDDDSPLTKLVENDDYTFSGNRLFLTSKFVAGWENDSTYGVTIRYKHQPQFYIWDINRQVADSIIFVDGKETQVKLPLSAIGRRAHYVLDADSVNISTPTFVSNSYIDNECDKKVIEVEMYGKMC